jgi:spore germination protein KC
LETKRKGIAKRALIVILCISLLFIEGCWGKREVEQLAFIIAIGIDQGENPQELLITYQFAQPKKGGQSGSEINEWTISTEVAHIPESMEKVYEILNRQPFLGTTKMIIIGEDLAKSGFNEAIDTYQRVYLFRRTMYLLVAKGTAQDILNTKLRNEQLPAISLLGRIEQYKGVSTFPVTRLGHYLTVLSREGQAPILPVVETLKSGEEGIQYEGEKKGKAEELRIQGVGVFKEGKLIGYLNDQETKGYMWLQNEVGTRFISSPQIDGVEVTTIVDNPKTSYSVSQEEDGLHFKYQVKVKGVIDEIKGKQSMMNYEEWAAFIKEAEKGIKQTVEKECYAAIQKDKGISADFLGIGRHIQQKKPSLWKEFKNNWDEKLSNLQVDVDVQVTLRHGGVARNSPVSAVSPQ